MFWFKRALIKFILKHSDFEPSGFFMVEAEVLRELMASPDWNRRLEQAETSRDVAKVIFDFCLEKGYKIGKVKLP